MKSVGVITAVILLLALSASAQVLRQMEVTEVPEGESVPYIVTNTEEAILIVHSTIRQMQFESTNPILQVDDDGGGEYILHLRPGTNVIKFKADGFVSVQERYVIGAKKYKELRIAPRGAAPSRDYGTVEFRLPPGPIFYYLDGSPTGTISVPSTGILSLKLEKGKHRITLARSGFEDIETVVDIRAGETTESGEKFTSGQSATATQDISSGILVVRSQPQGAKIYIDGVESGATDRQFRQIAVGSHQIRLEKLLYKDVVEQIEIGEEVFTLNKTLPPDFGELSVRTDPVGADILLDGTTVGQSSYSNLQLPSGPHSITLRKRYYHDTEWQIAVEPEDVLDTVVSLSPAFGRLEVTSQPQGARVLVNGSEWGDTPLSRDTVSSGSYMISVSKPLYGTYEATVQVEDGQPAIVNATLAEAFGSLSVKTEPSGVGVYSTDDGELLGQTPLAVRMAPGFYGLRIEDSLYEALEFDASLEIGQTVEFDTVLVRKTGTMRVFTEPFGADLYLDGEPIGQSPKVLKDYPTGEYVIEARMEGYATASQTVRVSDNQTDEVEIPLRKETYGVTETASTETLASAQRFRQMEVTEVPEGEWPRYIVRNADEAILIVHSTIKQLQFEFTNRFIRVEDDGAGEYTLHLRPGTHVIRFRAHGFVSVQERYVIAAKKYKEVRVVPKRGAGELIEELEPSSGTLNVTSEPSGMSVRLLERPSVCGTTPLSCAIATGSYTIEITDSLYETYTGIVSVNLHEDTEVHAPLTRKSGMVMVFCIPLEAEVYVDGVSVGETPVVLNDYPTGKYQVEARKMGFKTETQELLVEHNEVALLEFSLDFGRRSTD